ncbi:hypothetical protein V6Z11_D03G007200 [Gossypium hirsutum]
MIFLFPFLTFFGSKFIFFPLFLSSHSFTFPPNQEIDCICINEKSIISSKSNCEEKKVYTKSPIKNIDSYSQSIV